MASAKVRAMGISSATQAARLLMSPLPALADIGRGTDRTAPGASSSRSHCCRREQFVEVKELTLSSSSSSLLSLIIPRDLVAWIGFWPAMTMVTVMTMKSALTVSGRRVRATEADTWIERPNWVSCECNGHRSVFKYTPCTERGSTDDEGQTCWRKAYTLSP
jgi:hypothetical protein